MSETCIFCSIAADPTKLVWENDQFAAFNDIHPKAPVHVLIVPKIHIAMLDSVEDVELAGGLLLAVKAVAAQANIAGAYRVHINNGHAAGQEVDHLHVHLLGNIPSGNLEKQLREEGL